MAYMHIRWLVQMFSSNVQMFSARIAMLNGAPVIIVFNCLNIDICWEANYTTCVYFGNHAVWCRVVCYCGYVPYVYFRELVIYSWNKSSFTSPCFMVVQLVTLTSTIASFRQHDIVVVLGNGEVPTRREVAWSQPRRGLQTDRQTDIQLYLTMAVSEDTKQINW